MASDDSARPKMPKYVTDEVLETIAVVGTYEDVARKIKKRYGDFATRVEFNLPVRSPADHNRVRAVIRELHEGRDRRTSSA